MKKLLTLSIMLALGTSVSNYAQNAEVAPIVQGTPSTENTNALFDLLFNYDIGANIGAQGNAGVCFVNGNFWVSAWASDFIHVLDINGNLMETFSIPGVTGTRSMSWDGTNVYIGTAGTQVYLIDPVSRTIDNTITITPSTNATARMVAYDPTLDGGNGGFWTGNFSSDIASFDLNGSELSVIPLATHGTAIYGGAVDLVTPGGPYLWIHDQTTAGGGDLVVQLQLPGGTPTGVVYDYNLSGQPGGNTGIAGGLFISDEVVPGKVTIVGVSQGTPSDQLFGVELAETAGVNDNTLSNFSLSPNPASGKVNINTSVAGEKHVVIYDVLGKQVANTTVTGTELNISSLKAGVYLVSVTQNKSTATKKLVVQ
ncbi:hypothetical protein AEQU1_00239 [Aequorivita sp. CIP111184]|nr:hypothetical protein AEQU1_00239 [Aequorivita sp. CIP111184]